MADPAPPDAGMVPQGGCSGDGAAGATATTSDQLAQNRSPGIVKGTLRKVAPKGMPKNVKKPLHKSKAGGSIKPASGK